MTKLWYEIKKRLPFVRVDAKHCGLCKTSLANLEKNGIGPNEVLVIMPDVNAFGVVTKYHVGKCLRSQLEGSKIYDDLEANTLDKN